MPKMAQICVGANRWSRSHCRCRLTSAYEVIGKDVTHRVVQRPGTYVVLKYVRPVVKRKADAVMCSWSGAPAVWAGSLADVSLIARLLVGKFCHHRVLLLAPASN